MNISFIIIINTDALSVYTHAKRSRAHVKNPVVRVKIWWILETLKYSSMD